MRKAKMKSSDDNEVMNIWQTLKVTVETLELDVVKNAYGNNAAGVRARKGLREVKYLAHRLIVLTRDIDYKKNTQPPPVADDDK